MCQFASLIVTRDGRVFCFPGVDSHSEILALAGIPDDDAYTSNLKFCRVEITPPLGDKTVPVDKWDFYMDESQTPAWFSDEMKRDCYTALQKRMDIELSGKPYILRSSRGGIKYIKNNRLFNPFGPAKIDDFGKMSWYDENGLFHNDNGPAIWDPTTGEARWYFHGMRHRTDGPAIITEDTLEWYQNDRRHRTDGPAYISFKQREIMWYNNNMMHRKGGPAHVNINDGYAEWYEFHNHCASQYSNRSKIYVGNATRYNRVKGSRADVFVEAQEFIDAAEAGKWMPDNTSTVIQLSQPTVMSTPKPTPATPAATTTTPVATTTTPTIAAKTTKKTTKVTKVIAQKRSAAAKKAWATRRANRGW